MRRWDRAPDYVRQNLLAHAPAAGAVDELLTEGPACLAAVTLEGAAAALTDVAVRAMRMAVTAFRRAAYSGPSEVATRLAALQFHSALAGARSLADVLASGPVRLPGRRRGAPVDRRGGPAGCTDADLVGPTTSGRGPRRRGHRGLCRVVHRLRSRDPRPPRARHRRLRRRRRPRVVHRLDRRHRHGVPGRSSEGGRIPVWLATGPDAALDTEVELRTAPPVRHMAPILGPGGVDLLWLSAGTPGEMTVWTPRRTAGDARLFDPVPGTPDVAVPVALDAGSTAVVTLDPAGSLNLWTFPADHSRACASSSRRVAARGAHGAVVVVVDHGDGLAVHRWMWPASTQAPPDTVEHVVIGPSVEHAAVEIATGGPLVRIAVCLRSDQTTVVGAGDSDGAVCLWHVDPTGSVHDGPTAHTGEAVRALDFLDPDGRVVAVGGWSGGVQVFRRHGAALIPSALLNHGEHLAAVVPLGDGGGPLVATRSAGGLTKSGSPTPSPPPRRRTPRPGSPRSATSGRSPSQTRSTWWPPRPTARRSTSGCWVPTASMNPLAR